MKPLAITVVTSLYPSPPRPREGVFAERRWSGMAARGHRVRVIHPQPRTPPLARGSWREIACMPAGEEREGVAVRRPRYWHWPGAARGNARRFARAAAARLGEPRVVVCDYAWPAAALAPALVERGVPCLVCGRGSDVLAVGGEAGLAGPLGTYLRAAGRWFAVSEDLVAAMDRLGGAPGRGVLVPNGVDLELFRPRERAECWHHMGVESMDAPMLLCVGHLIPRKDPELALEVFRRGAPPDAGLLFVGRGPLERALRRRIRKRGLAHRVRLVGEVAPAALAQLYGMADAVLLCSRREGRPNAVLEALASGRAVLATEAGGTAELLDDPRMLARTRDPEVLGAMLAELLSHPPDPQALHARVAHLTWDASLDALESLLSVAVEEAVEEAVEGQVSEREQA